jgi:hypothetical protein
MAHSGAHKGKHPMHTQNKIHEGLTHKAARFPDKSAQFPKAPHVSKGATRDGTAKTPATIGPRTA